MLFLLNILIRIDSGITGNDRLDCINKCVVFIIELLGRDDCNGKATKGIYVLMMLVDQTAIFPDPE